MTSAINVTCVAAFHFLHQHMRLGFWLGFVIVECVNGDCWKMFFFFKSDLQKRMKVVTGSLIVFTSEEN